MDAKPPGTKALELEPVEGLTPSVDTARTVPDAAPAIPKVKRELSLSTSDEFLAAAAREYQEDRIDQALWRRATEQCGNDEALVIAAYLRARATALQLERKKDQRSQPQSPDGGSNRVASKRSVEAEPELDVESTEVGGWRARFKYLAAGAAAIALVLIGAVVWLIASPRQAELAQKPIVPAVAAGAGRATLLAAPGSEQPVVAAANQGAPDPTIQDKVQELRKAGNWNVLVLYASEWTRKEPKNAAAWHELSLAYMKLQQLEDAFNAATKAMQLSPEDALLWRSLGQVNLALGRLADAGVAFDKALAANSDDPDALCGAAMVAQKQGRTSDAEALSKRIKAADGGCPGMSEAGSVVVRASGSAAPKPVSSASR